MSLLMKALEKAARDRGEAPSSKSSAGAVSHDKGSISLEPVLPTARTAQTTTAKESTATTTSAAAQTQQPARTTSPRTREQAQAATVMIAQRQPQGSLGLWMRTHPLVVFGTLAGMFLAAYGIYVYLQVAHPGLFVRQPPASKPVIAAKAIPPPTVPAPQAIVAPTPSVTEPSSSGALIPSSAIVGKTPDTPGTAPSTVQPSPSAGAAPAAAPQLKPPSTPAATTASIAATPAGPREKITVSRGDANAPRVNPLASEGYAALESGRFDDAQRAYSQLARAEPHNIDALLGLAALAQRENKSEEASRLYMKALELDPRNAHAQSGLLAITGRADPQAAESRLKQLAAREPSASIYFTLGNLYADQSQWAQAQQAYFQAHHLDAANPDYAYNLAVGLEHLGQHKLALNFYRRALQLAAARNGANFNLAQAQARISQLAARVE